ncbi:MAG TPA: hypothetical protein VHS96_00430 [Bacteroidia bacterium]|nr:hypothetical protein [Bacteroidia bacterium]
MVYIMNQKQLFSLFLGFILASSLVLTGCFDQCRRVDCVYGVCESGTCDCAPGYEGDVCSTKISQKFLGSYNFEDHCNGPYLVTIHSFIYDPGTIVIKGLWSRPNDSVLATVDTLLTNWFNIRPQSYTSSDLTIEGSAERHTDGSMWVNYSIWSDMDGNYVDLCWGSLEP